MSDEIKILGARENNLKGVDVAIPKNALVAVAGVSSSGKSSLVFDTIAVESAREWQSSYPLYVRNKLPCYERPNVDAIENLTPSIVFRQKTLGANSRSTVATALDVAPLIRLLFSRAANPSAGGSMAYSFNHPAGMCPTCFGLGYETTLDEESFFDKTKTLRDGAILFSQFSSGWQSYLYQKNPLLNADKTLMDFSPNEWKILCYGCDSPLKIEINSNNTGRTDKVDYEGVIPRFKRLYLKRDISKLKKSLQNEILLHVKKIQCKMCDGTRLNPKALASKINGLNIIDYLKMNAAQLLPVISEIQTPVGKSIALQIASYLQNMESVGLGYLSLSRPTETLSGGEAQRLKIARNLGCSLNNITYIFDEPTAGLHSADAEKIGTLLLSLRDKHNNVLIVEHSRQMLTLADHVIELGPGAGKNGGEIVYEGDFNGLLCTGTVSALAMRQKIKINPTPLAWKEYFEISDAHCHNLKHINTKIPKGVLTVITGVAGSGKTTLAIFEFARRVPQAIVIDQKPIGTSIRSTPATYTGVMDEIRLIFSRENGVGVEWFSFNSKGACPICKGKGEISYEVAFADPVVVLCEECRGHRYNKKALSYKYKDKNIEEVLSLTIDEAINFFDDEKVKKPLQTLLDVGLGYMTLGQPTVTLSGGEIQRVKLASELQKSGNVYILDEPTVGLHSTDIKTLYKLLRKLVTNGNTVVIVEHKMDLIAKADWVIDMGTGGGDDGGEVLFSGTPYGLLGCKRSKTGEWLKKAISDNDSGY